MNYKEIYEASTILDSLNKFDHYTSLIKNLFEAYSSGNSLFHFFEKLDYDTKGKTNIEIMEHTLSSYIEQINHNTNIIKSLLEVSMNNYKNEIPIINKKVRIISNSIKGTEKIYYTILKPIERSKLYESLNNLKESINNFNNAIKAWNASRELKINELYNIS